MVAYRTQTGPNWWMGGWRSPLLQGSLTACFDAVTQQLFHNSHSWFHALLKVLLWFWRLKVLSLGGWGRGWPQYGATCPEQFRRNGGGRSQIAGVREPQGRCKSSEGCWRLSWLAEGTTTVSCALTNRNWALEPLLCACEVSISDQEPSTHRKDLGSTAGFYLHFTSLQISPRKKTQKHKTKNPVYLHVCAAVIFSERMLNQGQKSH